MLDFVRNCQTFFQSSCTILQSQQHGMRVPLSPHPCCHLFFVYLRYNWPVALYTFKVNNSVQLLSHVRLFETPWTAARQASLSVTNSQSLFKLISFESVMPSNHLILCCPLLLLSSIFPSIRVFSNESILHMRWPKHCSFSFSISSSNEHPGLISFRMVWLDLQTVMVATLISERLEIVFFYKLKKISIVIS